MNPKASEILFSLTNEQWRSILLHLQHYALSVSRGLRWRTGKLGDLPNGETVDSVVSQAIEKVLSGERKWDPDSKPDMVKYLMDVIDSLLSHHATGADNRLLVRSKKHGRGPEQMGADEPDIEGDMPQPAEQFAEESTEWMARPVPNPEQRFIEAEQQMQSEKAMSILVQGCASDPVLHRMLPLIQEGVSRPAEIAAKLAIPVGSVYNANKRLDRKLADVAARVRQEIGGM